MATIKKALDYGCGKDSMAAIRRLGYFTVGADLDYRPGCKPMVVFDGSLLPFKDNAFDVVISQQVIEHVEHLEDYFGEARRVLRSGGKMFAEFPTRIKPFDSHKQTWFKHWFRMPKEPWFAFRWPWAIRRIARRYFHVEDVTRARLKAQNRSWLPCWAVNQSWVLT